MNYQYYFNLLNDWIVFSFLDDIWGEPLPGVSMDLIVLATRHLHRMGELFYSDDGNQGPLKDIVILDMAWLGQDLLGWLHCPAFMLAAHQRVDWIRFQDMAGQGAVAVSWIPIGEMAGLSKQASLDVLEHFAQCYSFKVGGGEKWI